MNWSTIPNARILNWICTDHFDAVDGEHDGYTRLPDPVVHRRMIFSDRKEFSIIFDYLTADSEHRYDYNLHVHPSIQVSVKPEIINLKPDNENCSISLCMKSKDNFEISLYNGSEDPRSGWYSDGYAIKETSTTINMASKGRGDTHFCMLITPRDISEFTFSYTANAEIVTRKPTHRQPWIASCRFSDGLY